MMARMTNSRIAVDVKCYHCGHISGQILGWRNRPLRAGDFVPRPGYCGPQVKPGMKLRCERCDGPVFLEDATNSLPPPRRRRRASRSAGRATR